MSQQGVKSKHKNNGKNGMRGFVILRQAQHDNSKNGTMIKKKIKFFDACAGMGTARMAFEQVGWICVGFAEIDRQTEKVYRHFFGVDEQNYGDLFSLKPTTLPDFDCLVAGFPCQSFSVAGKRKGFEDKRGEVFFELLRILHTKKPPVFLFENVKGLVAHNSGKTFNKIIDALKRLGYGVLCHVMNTCDYSDIPQNRERVFIVGFRDEKAYSSFRFPQRVLRTKPIACFLESNVDDKYFYRKGKIFNAFKKYLKNRKEKQKEEWKNSLFPPLRIAVGETEMYSFFSYRRNYFRITTSSLCPTLTANMGTGGNNIPLIPVYYYGWGELKAMKTPLVPTLRAEIGKDHQSAPLIEADSVLRRLTPRECARVQGVPECFSFPEGVSDSVLYHSIGNAMTVPVVAGIAEQIKVLVA